MSVGALFDFNSQKLTRPLPVVAGTSTERRGPKLLNPRRSASAEAAALNGSHGAALMNGNRSGCVAPLPAWLLITSNHAGYDYGATQRVMYDCS